MLFSLFWPHWFWLRRPYCGKRDWEKKTGKLEKATKYTLIEKRGDDGLMHIVSEKTEDMLVKKKKKSRLQGEEL